MTSRGCSPRDCSGPAGMRWGLRLVPGSRCGQGLAWGWGQPRAVAVPRGSRPAGEVSEGLQEVTGGREGGGDASGQGEQGRKGPESGRWKK